VVDAYPGTQVHVNLGGGCGAFLTIYWEPQRACVGRGEPL